MRVFLSRCALAAGAMVGWAHAAQPAVPPTTLDTVVVTVQKRPEPAREVPMALTTVNARTLDRLRVGGLEDAASLAPNTVFTQASGVNALTVRGVGGGGRNVGFDPRVGVYLDGVYIGQAQALTMPWLDLEQTVFLRGPQGHWFGRNSVAGAVALTSRAPTADLEGELRLGAGDRAARSAHAVVSGPLLGERLTGRIAWSHERHDGTIGNAFTGERWGDLDRRAGRARLRWDPSEAWRVDLAFDRAHQRQRTPFGEPTTDFFDTPLAAGRRRARTVDFDVTPYADLTTRGSALTAVRTAANGATWTLIAGDRRTRQERQNDSDYSRADLLRVNYTDAFKQRSWEARWASSEQGPARAVLGVYSAQEDARTHRLVTIGRDVTALVPVPGRSGRWPFGASFGLKPGFGALAQARVRTDSTAVFGTWDRDWGERWTVSVGGRYTREHKRLAFDLNGAGSGGLRIATVQRQQRRRDESVSPRVSVLFRATPTLNGYVTYATGFKSGGWNVDFLNAGQASGGIGFAPETVRSVEVGAKGQTPNGRWTYEAAVFQAGYDDFQVFQFVPLGGGAAVLQMRNAAKVRSRGAEASVQWRPSARWTLAGQLGALDARFMRFPDGAGVGQDLDGRRLPDAPKWTAALQVAYRQPLAVGALTWQLEHAYQSASFAAAANDPRSDRIGARQLTNARLAYTAGSGRWSAGAWVKNAFDRTDVWVRGRDFFGNQVSQHGDPRQVGVDVTWTF